MVRLLLASTLAMALGMPTPSALAAHPAPSHPPDRQEVLDRLMDAGFSGIATLRLERRRWVGIGAHDGDVVAFTVDAATLRIVSELKAH